MEQTKREAEEQAAFSSGWEEDVGRGGAYTVYIYIYIYIYICVFGGLGVACWPLVPKFAGSNPAESVGYLGRKIPQHTFLRRGIKAVGPMS